MNKMLKTGFYTIIIGLLVGCAPNNSDSFADKKAKMAITGSIVGGVASYNLFSNSAPSTQMIAAYLGGTAGGLLAPDAIQQLLSTEDKRLRKAALFHSLQEGVIGKSSEWESKTSETHGAITSLNQYSDEKGQLCREFSEITIIDNNRIEEERTACLDPTGYWLAE